jgi:hypothetical protein
MKTIVTIMPELNEDVFNICATIFVVALVMIFILSVIKKILAHKLKNKIIEKGIPEALAASVLRQNPDEDQHANIKWFAILTGLGIGLTIVHYTLPLGIHSLAILSFCIAAAFLGYFFFIRSAKSN